jgi:hypothetical protein
MTAPEFENGRFQVSVRSGLPDQALNLLDTISDLLLRKDEWRFSRPGCCDCILCRREDELGGRVWSGLARKYVSSYDLQNKERRYQSDDEEYARIDYNVQKIAVVLGRVGVGGRLSLIAHLE